MMQNSWRNIEQEILSQYEDELQVSQESEEFLQSLGFIDDQGRITDLGRNYLDSKHIFETKEHQAILRNQLLNLNEIRELCQSFYGQKTERSKVERFFKSKTEVSDPKEVGRLLDLLNKVDIVSYSKRNGTVQFKETDQVEEESQESYRVTHRTPYSNLMRFRKALRSCEGDLLWIDRHFTKKGLEPLAEELTGDKFDSVRILSGPANVDTHLRDDFKRFKQEMDNRDIEGELRVITDKDKLRKLHDRWIISTKGDSWNIPPINSLYGNQEAEIIKTTEELDFGEWWDEAEDILTDWNNIQKYI